MIKKARIEDALYDVITYEEYMRNKEIYSRYASNIAIESGGFLGFILLRLRTMEQWNTVKLYLSYPKTMKKRPSMM